MEVRRVQDGVFVSQQKYAIEILERFRMQDCKPTVTPMDMKTKLCKYDSSPEVDSILYMQSVGSLLYLTNTQTDLSYLVGMQAGFHKHHTRSIGLKH